MVVVRNMCSHSVKSSVLEDLLFQSKPHRDEKALLVGVVTNKGSFLGTKVQRCSEASNMQPVTAWSLVTLGFNPSACLPCNLGQVILFCLIFFLN